MIPTPYTPLAQQQPDYSDIATKRMNQFLNLMNRFDSLSWKTIKNVITTGVWDKKEQTRLFFLMKSSILQKKEPKDVEGLEISLRAAVPASFHIAERIGGLSAIGSMVFEPEEMLDDYDLYNPDLPIANFDEGNFGRMSGNPRAGKTNDSCVFIEQWIKKKRLAVSNIFKTESNNAYEYSNNARSLFEIVASFQRKTKWIFVYDEGGASGYQKAQASSLKSQYLDRVCRIIGKLYGNVLYIDQRIISVPQTIQDFSTSLYHAVDKGVLHIELKHPKKFNRTVANFPKTSLPYDTRDIAHFEMNVNVDKMFTVMSGADKPYDVMADFLKTKESIPPKGRIT